MERVLLRVALLLLLTMLTLPAMNASAAIQFSDVNSGYWAYNEIYYLADKQIIRGKNGKFLPEDSIKRMQAAEMIVKALGLSTENRPNPNFKDIKPGDYGYEYAATLADEGIMTGNNGYFKPWDTLTRGQMAKILSEAYNLTYAFGSIFDDVDFDSWLYDYVSCLVDNHITTGYNDNTYRPNAKLKRSQFAAFMARVLDDSFKPAVLFKTIDYDWDQDGGLTLLVEVRNNFSYPVEVTDAPIAVKANGEWIAEDWFEFAPNELYLQAKQSKQIQLYFQPDYTYIEPTDLTDIVLFSRTALIKK
jgi:SLAP domain-containing protein